MTHVVYIPGLGDHFDSLRKLTLHRWKSAKTKVTFIPMHWNNRKETYQEKHARIVDTIARIDDEIVLVGESAGGAMALLAFAHHPDRIQKVVTVCGYNHGAADVHPYHRYKHPAFYQLVPIVDDIVKNLTTEMRTHITTIYSTRDHVVTPDHSHIDGAKEIIISIPGHFTSIARTLIHKTPLR